MEIFVICDKFFFFFRKLVRITESPSFSTREFTVLENDGAQELRGQAIENWPY